MASVLFVQFPSPPPVIPVVPGFPSTTIGSGSLLVVPGPFSIPVPIPAGVNLMFGLVAEVIGKDVTPGNASTSQKIWYTAVRNGLGALEVFTSDTNATERQGSGLNVPQRAGISILDADNVNLDFDNTTLANARVIYTIAISGPFPAV